MNMNFTSFANRLVNASNNAAAVVAAKAPVYGKQLDHAVAVAKPVVQEKVAVAIGESSYFVYENMGKAMKFADRLREKAVAGYAAATTGAPAPKKMKINIEGIFALIPEDKRNGAKTAEEFFSLGFTK